MLKKSITAFLTFTCLALFSHSIDAGTIAHGRAIVIDKNEGNASQQAILNAQREAVEKGVGVLIDSKTITENWRLIQDEIFSSARGYVTGYKITEDKISGDGKEWLITIDAEVATVNLQNKLENLRILHKKMGNKSYAIFYSSYGPNEPNANSKVVVDSMSAIQEAFSSNGFRIFHLDALGDKPDFDAVLQKAEENNIDLLVKFAVVDTSQKTEVSGLYTVKADVMLELWDVFSARFIANAQSFKKEFLKGRTPSKVIWEKKLADVGRKAATEAAQEAIKKTVNYYTEIGDMGNSFSIVFENYTEDTEDLILQSMENLEGFQSLKEVENRPGYLRVEYFSSLGKSRLRRALRSATKTQGIELMSKEMTGNRLHFMKPGTE